jgi:hypothetical protein
VKPIIFDIGKEEINDPSLDLLILISKASYVSIQNFFQSFLLFPVVKKIKMQYA